ncbi:hypothetical protein LFD09_004338 [Salmonella enterica]|nr:hypothetical protein [Salmonella enterica]
MKPIYKTLAAQVLCLVLAFFSAALSAPLLGGIFLIAALLPVFRFLLMGPKK